MTMNNKPLVLLTLSALFAMSASALADDKTPSDPSNGQKLKEERAARPDPVYGGSPARTQRGTPLVGDFNEKGKYRQPTPKGSFGPPGGRAQMKAIRDEQQKLDQLQREESRRAWDKKYGPDDPSKKGPGQ